MFELPVLMQPEFPTKTKAGQLDLAHLDFGGFTETSFYKSLRVVDHILTFLAFDKEGMLPAFQGIRNEIM